MAVATIIGIILLGLFFILFGAIIWIASIVIMLDMIDPDSEMTEEERIEYINKALSHSISNIDNSLM